MNHSSLEKLRVYLWILSYVKKYRVKFIAVILLGLFSYFVQLAVPQFNQRLIDHVLPTQNMNLFWWMLVILVASVFIMFLAVLGKNLLHRHVHENISKDLQLSMVDKLRKLGFSYFERESAGSTLSMFNTDVPAAQSIYRDYLPSLILQSLFLLASLGFMFVIDFKLALYTIPCFLLHYLATPYFAKRTVSYEQKVQTLRPEYEKKVYESISALSEVRANGVQKWDVNRAMEKHQLYFHNFIKLLFFRYANMNVRVFTIYMGVAVFFLIGADLVRTEQISIGQFVAFGTYYFQAAYTFTSIVNMISEQSLSLVQVQRLHQFNNLKPDVNQMEETINLERVEGHITFQNVTFSYPGREPILNGFSMHIPAGKKVALVGESGSGKTSIIKLLSRFYDPQLGEILIDQTPIKKLTLEQLRDSIGVVFQETYLFGSTIKENIRFGNPQAKDEEVIEAAKSAYIHDFIMTLPAGYETVVGERGINLSGGQKQRIAIARMIIKNPQIIILDEATSALDNVTEKEVQNALQKLSRGKTTIAVAHRLSTVKDFDQLLYMEEGEVMEAGTYQELMERKGKFFSLMQHHTRKKEGES